MSGYPSYLYGYENHICIALKSVDGCTGGINICRKDNLEKIEEFEEQISYTHIYEDDSYILAASYHQGLVKIIIKNTYFIIIKRYENAKIHQVGKISDKLYYAVDLENNCVYIFEIINNEIVEKCNIKLEEDSHPRHLISTNEGKNLYIVCEGCSEILNYSFKDNRYVKVQEIETTLNKSKNMASAIRIYNNYLFASNRGDDTIAMYQILQDGRLEHLKQFDVKGKCPRDFNITKDGKYLIVANEKSNKVNIFEINYIENQIYLTSEIDIVKPVCIEI